ncbi:MAG: DUF58 domain-containing protein [Chitinophagaceae bacterium]|nr:DUF58 domain-containing protein [Chitinophagaceae bacterium]
MLPDDYKKPSFNLFFTNRFYAIGIGVACVYVASWALGFAMDIAGITLMAFCLLTLGEITALFANKAGIGIKRIVPERMSNGDSNAIILKIRSHYIFPTRLQIIEELPEQLQARGNKFDLKLEAQATLSQTYTLKPVRRGVYHFGFCQLYISTRLGLVHRRIATAQPQQVKVYPSFIQLRQYQILAHAASEAESGTKRMRKIGHSLEFEQIKEYVRGDDIRSINWKATARKGSLMVNHFVDERSQQVYALIDKGRLMKMPFNGITLLDYAINATLVLCNVSLYRQDKFGLYHFSNEPGQLLPAQRNPLQLNLVLESLYRIETAFLESDYEKLYLQVRAQIKHRSLLVLFTQFESMGGMKRQLPYLQQLSRHHLLLVVFFENTELTAMAQAEAGSVEEIYTKTIAEKFVYEKKLIVKELLQHGILSLLTPPDKLTIQLINKYLELKSKQAI